MSTAPGIEIHKFGCQRLGDISARCTCGESRVIPDEQTEMRSLREMRESLAALVTEVRGLREDQQRMNGLLLEAVQGARESAMRNHTQVMDALKNLAVGPATRNDPEGSADGNGAVGRSPLAARPKRGKRRK